ncbi:MAG: response regulator [Anaeromyxobacter sp.]|nr:response regulator [Anaeromyxobacter sp.]
MEPELFRQIWPVFSAEAREHLAVISGGVLELEADPARVALLDPIRRTAHSLKGSAASLGLGDVEALAHAIEGSLAGYRPEVGLGREVVQVILDAIEAVEEAVAAADAGGPPTVASLEALLAGLGVGDAPRRRAADAWRVGAPSPAQPRARAWPRPDDPEPREPEPEPEPAATAPVGLAATTAGPLARLEVALEALCAPVDDAARAALVAEASAAGRDLAAAVPAHARELAERVAGGFPGLGAGGAAAARAAAALAGDLVELRQRLEQPPSAPGAGAAAAEPRHADKSIRVLTSTLDSLARQLELLSLSEARHARRAREVAATEDRSREVVRRLEQALHALRSSDPAEARTAVEAAAARLRGLTADLRRLARDGQREAEAQQLAGAVLRDDLRALRMVPAALMLEPLKRAVREVAGRLGKLVEVEVAGGDVKLDRRIADELRDPLLHLVRNAADHGIEAAAVRLAAGKPEGGRLTVRVEPRGSRVGVVVEDDGRGLDLAAVKASAVRRGLLAADAAARLSDEDAARLIFLPGFSTARAVTAISGRGVGLDVVQSTVARLGGAVDVTSVPGRSTRFDLELPLTLAATAAILFRVGRDLAALSADSVERVLLLAPADVGTVAGRATVEVGRVQLPVAWLSQLLGLPPGRATGKAVPALVLALGAQRAVVVVDEVLGQQEVVVGALGLRAAGATHLAGASVLDDGRVVGVLNAAEVLRRFLPAAARPAAATPPRVVVADDSLTTRAAMKALLELAGYQVAVAGDGEEALALVRDGGAALVVTDVQMPRLDGLGLVRRLKADRALAAIPVVLVTSLDTPEDRAAGLAAGAAGYLVKREVERGRLLELVRQLLPGGP